MGASLHELLLLCHLFFASLKFLIGFAFYNAETCYHTSPSLSPVSSTVPFSPLLSLCPSHFPLSLSSCHFPTHSLPTLSFFSFSLSCVCVNMHAQHKHNKLTHTRHTLSTCHTHTKHTHTNHINTCQTYIQNVYLKFSTLFLTHNDTYYDNSTNTYQDFLQLINKTSQFQRSTKLLAGWTNMLLTEISFAHWI